MDNTDLEAADAARAGRDLLRTMEKVHQLCREVRLNKEEEEEIIESCALPGHGSEL